MTSKNIQAEALKMIESFVPEQRGRRPADLPRLTDHQGRALPRYLVEKVVGLRRENGAAKLKRLTARHLRILGAHIAGRSLEQNAVENSVSIPTVSRVLNDPLGKQMLERIYSGREHEIKAMAGQSIEAVREGLDPKQSITTRLRAVNAYSKMREAILPNGNERETAEDVIARMLSSGTVIHGDVNVQINQGISNETV